MLVVVVFALFIVLASATNTIHYDNEANDDDDAHEIFVDYCR